MDALTMSYERGMYKDFSEIHFENFAPAHNEAPFFLPWHRWFLFVFENELRKMDDRFRCITIPYWTWETTSFTGTHYLFNENAFGSRVDGCVQDGYWYGWWWNSTSLSRDDDDPTPQCLLRTWPRQVSVCGQACTINIIAKGSRWKEFGLEYEDVVHKCPHKLCGGIVNGAKSTYDPIFWLLHSNVDRHWAIWQDCHDHDKVSEENLSESQYYGQKFGIKEDMDSCMPFSHHGKPTRYFPSCVTVRMVYRIQQNRDPKFTYYYSDASHITNLLEQNFGRCNFDWNWNWDSEKNSEWNAGSYNSGDKKRKINEISSGKMNNHVTLQSGDHTVQLSWSLSETNDIITIRAESNAAKESWLGIGWGGDDNMMTNADMVIATKQNSKWTVSDYFSLGYEIPTKDNHQDIFDTSAGFSQGKIWMEFSRHLSTNDLQQDKQIKEGPIHLAFAVGFSHKLTNQAHQFASHQKVTLINNLNYYATTSQHSEQNEVVIPEPVFLEPQFFFFLTENMERVFQLNRRVIRRLKLNLATFLFNVPNMISTNTTSTTHSY